MLAYVDVYDNLKIKDILTVSNPFRESHLPLISVYKPVAPAAIYHERAISCLPRGPVGAPAQPVTVSRFSLLLLFPLSFPAMDRFSFVPHFHCSPSTNASGRGGVDVDRSVFDHAKE